MEKNLIPFSDLVNTFNKKNKTERKFYQKNKDGKMAHPPTNSIQAGSLIVFFMASMF